MKFRQYSGMYGSSSRSDAQLWWTSQSMMGPEYKLCLLSAGCLWQSEEPPRVGFEHTVLPARWQSAADVVWPFCIAVRVATGIHQHVLQAGCTAPQPVQLCKLLTRLGLQRMTAQVQWPGGEETVCPKILARGLCQPGCFAPHGFVVGVESPQHPGHPGGAGAGNEHFQRWIFDENAFTDARQQVGHDWLRREHPPLGVRLGQAAAQLIGGVTAVVQHNWQVQVGRGGVNRVIQRMSKWQTETVAGHDYANESTVFAPAPYFVCRFLGQMIWREDERSEALVFLQPSGAGPFVGGAADLQRKIGVGQGRREHRGVVAEYRHVHVVEEMIADQVHVCTGNSASLCWVAFGKKVVDRVLIGIAGVDGDLPVSIGNAARLAEILPPWRGHEGHDFVLAAPVVVYERVNGAHAGTLACSTIARNSSSEMGWWRSVLRRLTSSRRRESMESGTSMPSSAAFCLIKLAPTIGPSSKRPGSAPTISGMTANHASG